MLATDYWLMSWTCPGLLMHQGSVVALAGKVAKLTATSKNLQKCCYSMTPTQKQLRNQINNVLQVDDPPYSQCTDWPESNTI